VDALLPNKIDLVITISLLKQIFIVYREIEALYIEVYNIETGLYACSSIQVTGSDDKYSVT